MLPHPTICSTETKWLAVCAALAIGEYCGFRCQPWAAAWPLALLLATLCALFGFGLPAKGWPYAALAFVGAALALLDVSRHGAVLNDILVRSSGRPHCAVFTLRDDARVSQTPKGAVLAEFPGRIGALRVNVVASLPPGSNPPKAGETWQCTGWLSGFHDDNALRRRTFSVRGKRASIVRLADGTEAWSWRRALCAMKKSAARRLRAGLDGNEDSHRLLCAMLLGERSLMNARERQDFIGAGAIHVFAISGLHVMVVARIFILVSVATLLPLRFAGVVAVPLLWLYVMMVGSPPSAVRAAGMASLCMAAPMFWRRPNGIVAWAMAFFAAHVANPSQLMDAGSGLSFAVMLAIVVTIRLCGWAVNRPVFGTLLVSSIAWAAGLPIAVRLFGHISFGGLLAGPIVIPAATCATICGAVGIMASFISPHLAAYPNAFAGLIMRFMTAVSAMIAKIPGAYLNVANWSMVECLAWYAALAAAMWLAVRIHERRATTI